MSSGIGAAYAKALAEQGADVAILARRKQKLERVAEECRSFGAKCLSVVCDVTAEDSIKAAVQEIADAFGRIDVLINNAGVCEFSLLEDHTTEQWNKVIATDLPSAFLMTREVEPYFKNQGYGRVVNTASVGALEAGAMQISCLAAKGGILQVTRELAAELAPFGVLVNVIAPGVFATEMTDGMLEAEGSLVLKNRTCLKPLCRAQGAVPADAASGIRGEHVLHGTDIYVDGGLTSQL